MPRGVASLAALALAAGLLLPACLFADRARRGALLPAEAIESLRDGVTTRAEVVRSFGPPVVMARREGTVRIRILDEPRVGDVEWAGLMCFGPLARLPAEPGDLVYLYRTARIWERYEVDHGPPCRYCLPTETRSGSQESTFDELYLLFDERTGILRAHANLRDGKPRPPSAGTSNPAPASQGSLP